MSERKPNRPDINDIHRRKAAVDECLLMAHSRQSWIALFMRKLMSKTIDYTCKITR